MEGHAALVDDLGDGTEQAVGVGLAEARAGGDEGGVLVALLGALALVGRAGSEGAAPGVVQQLTGVGGDRAADVDHLLAPRQAGQRRDQPLELEGGELKLVLGLADELLDLGLQDLGAGGDEAAGGGRRGGLDLLQQAREVGRRPSARRPGLDLVEAGEDQARARW